MKYLNYVVPFGLFLYSSILRYWGDKTFSIWVFVLATFLWLLVWGNSNNPKNKGNV